MTTCLKADLLDFDYLKNAKTWPTAKNTIADAEPCVGFSTSNSVNFEKKLAICVRNDYYNGNHYSIILHKVHGELAAKDKEITPGTWVLFTQTNEQFFIESQYKALVGDDIEETTYRCPPVMRNLKKLQTFQVQVFLDSRNYVFNEHFYMCTDEILGQVLVGKNDKFINKSFKNKKRMEMVVVYQQNYARQLNWVAIAVNKGGPDYIVIEKLPRLLNQLAKKMYAK